MFDGYWHARHGEVNGIAQLRLGVVELTAAGLRGGYVYQRLLLIKVYLAAGQNDEAQRMAAEAQVFIEQSGYADVLGRLFAALHQIEAHAKRITTVRGCRFSVTSLIKGAPSRCIGLGVLAWTGEATWSGV